MRYNFLILSFIVFFVSGFLESCGSETRVRPLPKRPKNVVIRLFESGGMYPENKEIFLSADSSYYLIVRNGIEQKLSFEISQKELKSLYDVFLDESFHRIKMTNQPHVSDRGGTTIILDVDGIEVEKKDAGLSFIQKKHVDQFRAVETAIWDLVMAKLKDKKIEVHFILQEAIYNSGFYFYLSINDQRITYSKEDAIVSDYPVYLLPGKNKVDVGLYYKDSVDYNGQPKLFTRTSSYVDVKSNTNKVFLDLLHGAIQFKE